MNNEYLTLTGRYPVGKNGSWHSGIHIRGNEIYPMLEGWLAAYRISTGYNKVPRLKEMTEAEYNHLDRQEQGFYEAHRTRKKRYILKETLPKYLESYRDEQYSNSFFLIRHRVRLPNSIDPKCLEFFTLYTNIDPAEARNDQYSPPGVFLNRKIPFYDKFVFRAANDLSHEYACFTAKDGKKVFPGSHCEWRYKNAGTMICKPLNSSDEIDVPVNDIAISGNRKPTYKLVSKDIPFYKKKCRNPILRIKN
jgi:hypothetical protein